MPRTGGEGVVAGTALDDAGDPAPANAAIVIVAPSKVDIAGYDAAIDDGVIGIVSVAGDVSDELAVIDQPDPAAETCVNRIIGAADGCMHIIVDERRRTRCGPNLDADVVRAVKPGARVVDRAASNGGDCDDADAPAVNLAVVGDRDVIGTAAQVYGGVGGSEYVAVIYDRLEISANVKSM